MSLAVSPAQARPGLTTGFLETRYSSSNALERNQSFDSTVDARAGIIREHAFWRAIAATKPSDPRNPADPAYNWGRLDDTVRGARSHDLAVLLTITGAPNWAEGKNRPNNVNPGAWKPRPNALDDFAHAIAERYSGDFLGLPRVKHFQAWNEPTLDVHLAPQYNGKRQVSAAHYKRMLNAFYGGVKSVHDDNVVVTGGTAPYGEPPGGDRTRPLTFWRKVLCLKDRRQLNDSACPVKPKFDILAHHPINTSGGPRQSAINPNDASTPDLDKVRRTLRAAERHDNVFTPGRHPLWATELWWESDPPDGFEGIPLQKHARYIEEALYILWRDGARVVINLQLRDAAFDRNNPFGETVTGVFFRNGDPKPAYTAFRFPFVTERQSRSRIRAWGKAPASGQLRIQRRQNGDWQTMKTLPAASGEVFSTSVRLRGREELRATVAGNTSLVWQQRG